jgi:hypothetical protein
MKSILSQEQRRITCIHEAAHAVIQALGGLWVSRVTVAPLGATPDWTMESVKGHIQYGLLGLCEGSGLDIIGISEWNDDECRVEVNYDSFKAYIQSFDNSSPKREAARWRKEYFRHMRAHVCIQLAGKVAEQILDGIPSGEIWVDPSKWSDTPHDEHWAAAICRLLPYRNEFDYLTTETERMLRTPEVWERVTKLADELEQHGVVGNDEDEIPFLPERLEGWPSSPRSKAA